MNVSALGAETEHGYWRCGLAAVVPTLTASLRLSVPGDVSHGDGRPRTSCLGGSQHNRLCSRRQGPRLFTRFWASNYRECQNVLLCY